MVLLVFGNACANFVSPAATECNPQRPDLSSDRFIQGSAVISYKVLSLINISLIQHLYTSLTREQVCLFSTAFVGFFFFKLLL